MGLGSGLEREPPAERSGEEVHQAVERGVQAGLVRRETVVVVEVEEGHL